MGGWVGGCLDGGSGVVECVSVCVCCVCVPGRDREAAAAASARQEGRGRKRDAAGARAERERERERDARGARTHTKRTCSSTPLCASTFGHGFLTLPVAVSTGGTTSYRLLTSLNIG